MLIFKMGSFLLQVCHLDKEEQHLHIYIYDIIIIIFALAYLVTVSSDTKAGEDASGQLFL